MCSFFQQIYEICTLYIGQGNFQSFSPGAHRLRYTHNLSKCNKGSNKDRRTLLSGIKGKSDELSQREAGRKPIECVTEESCKAGIGIFQISWGDVIGSVL